MVLNDPLHFMYSKVNKFLNKSPNWEIAKLPSYWVDKVCLNPPADDDTHQREVQWVLDTLIDGLRTEEVIPKNVWVPQTDMSIGHGTLSEVQHL